MAQHDFVPAWLNFSTPQPAKYPHHHHPHPVCWLAGDGWQPPSLLLRHDSVDSGVAKGGHGGLAGGSCWKEAPGWHGAPRGGQDAHHPPGRHPKRVGGDRDRQGGHRQRNGSFHPRKGGSFQDQFPGEERKEDKLKFLEEDFPSLNPEATGKPGPQVRAPAPHAGVWENPPSGKQTVSKMLVIKKMSKEDPSAAFLAGFAAAGALSTNGSRSPMLGSSVYQNLLPKPSGAPTKQQPSSTTPPIDIVPSRLKLMRRGPDRKSEFLRALKDEGPGDTTTSSSSPATSGEGDGGTPEPKADGEEGAAHENGLAYSLSDSDTEHLSSSLEAEHRLLKSMGWQECPENDDNFLPLTEDELREFQTKTEQLKRGGLQRNGVLPRPRGVTLHFTPWRSEPHVDEEDEDEGSETSSSSQTSDDEGGVRP
ncbi:unnamed protein product [Boreogadus saida]